MAQPAQSENLSLSQHVVYICSRFLAYGVPLLFFLVSVSFYLKTYDSAQVKITFTQIGTTVLLLVWITKILIEGHLPFYREDWVYIAPFLAYLASGLLSYAHTSFKPWALEETLRRVFYVVLALIVIAEFRSEERMERLWRWLLAAAWVAIGYGFLQYIDSRFFPGAQQAGIDPFIWRQAFASRIFSTYGNPNFFGNFLVIITPLILASVLRGRGELGRPFIVLAITLILVITIDKATIGLMGGVDSSYQVVVGALIVALLGVFVFLCFWRTGGGSQPSLLILFALLFLNLYATETKGAWVGFISAVGVTTLLIFEYFVHFEERMIASKTYMGILAGLIALYAAVDLAMIYAFVVPMFRKSVDQIGFQILWIPTLIAIAVSTWVALWLMRRPWNLKKIIYGALLFFIIAMGGFVLQFAKNRLQSVSFRLFTWISTWEMVRSSPLLGNGVGTFKVIYPAYRRPEIIVLEDKSNTETDHAEDEYIEVWQDEGVVGFGVFLWLVITALVLGLKQLRWFSRSRSPSGDKRARLSDLQADARSYRVLGYTGAYIGALIHWTMDVSIRFVSSGIFSGFLPGVIVAYARNQQHVVFEEVRLGYDRAIRASVAAVWTAIMLWLGMELVPSSIAAGETTTAQIWTFTALAGLALFIGLELLERGVPSESNVPFSEQYREINPRFQPLRLGVLVCVILGGLASANLFRGLFLADVNHNLAIFFSKESIWTKSPLYDQKMSGLPYDLRKRYEEIGGALEHYGEVIRYNPAFPMAWYFRGNVYNDWGSQKNADSLAARARGDIGEAQRLRDEASGLWDKAEEAYNGAKRLAPNYVQTHHQMGLLYLKRADQAQAWNDGAAAERYFAEAEKNFRLYRMLDPVFPPNHDRLVQLLVRKGKFDEAAQLYEQGIYYNDVVSLLISRVVEAQRVSDMALNLAKLRLEQARAQDPAHPFQSPVIPDVVKYFRMATEFAPKNVDAWKGLAYILNQTGQRAELPAIWQKLHELAPNDPDVRALPSPQ